MKTEILRRFASLTLLAVASLAAGCGSSVEGDDGEGTGGSGGGESTSTGTPTCEGEFLGDCPGDAGAVCVDGQWQCGATSSTSTGNTETCPDVRPPPETACSPEGMSCEVPSDLDCGPPTVTITCVDGVWLDSVPRCLPLICRDLADADQCVQNGCRWQEPGCGESPLPVAGCFDVVDCAPDSCFQSDEICVNVSVVPACASEDPGCDSCSEQVQLCVPHLVGEDGGAG